MNNRVHVYALRARSDFTAAAQEVKSLIEAGDATARAFAVLNGIDPAAPLHTQVLDALAKAARLESWDIAREVMPEEAKGARELAGEVVRRRAATTEEASRSFRFLPERAAGSLLANETSSLEARVLEAAAQQGFETTHSTSKKIELTHRGRRQVVYIDRNRAVSGVIALIVPPWSNLQHLARIDGLEVPEASRYYHSSNLRVFPRHEHRGKNQIPYGYSIVCRTNGSLTRLLEAI